MRFKGEAIWLSLRPREAFCAQAMRCDVEEILLSRKQLQTDYTYSTSLSLSYSFGSIFNNLVNPRLGGGGIGIPIIVF